MSIAPIGVFDSGLGGITVLKELVQRLPQEDFLYIADSGHCPYGGKSADQITARARAITEALLARGAKLIVTYHPAYCLRSPSAKRPVWEDLQRLAQEYLAD